MVSEIYTGDLCKIRIASERRELIFAARDVLQTAPSVGHKTSLVCNRLFGA